jgi:uncharacterized membrane protein (DUF485 family)
MTNEKKATIYTVLIGFAVALFFGAATLHPMVFFGLLLLFGLFVIGAVFFGVLVTIYDVILDRLNRGEPAGGRYED